MREVVSPGRRLSTSESLFTHVLVLMAGSNLLALIESLARLPSFPGWPGGLRATYLLWVAGVIACGALSIGGGVLSQRRGALVVRPFVFLIALYLLALSYDASRFTFLPLSVNLYAGILPVALGINLLGLLPAAWFVLILRSARASHRPTPQLPIAHGE